MTEPVFQWLADYTGSPPDKCRAEWNTWKVTYHLEGATPAAAALTQGQEIHFIVAPAWRVRLIQRHKTRAFLAPLLEQAGGMLTTRILRGMDGPTRFVERIGFQKTWSDEKFDFYALCSAPFQRRTA